MSIRQPVSSITTANREAIPHLSGNARTPAAFGPLLPKIPSNFNFEYSVRLHLFQKRLRLLQIELPVASLDAKEKSVRRSQRKSRHVEHRMIGRRETIHNEHPENSRQRRSQNR